MKFIKVFNNIINGETYINVDAIESVFSRDNITHINPIDSSCCFWEVRESVDEIMRKIQEADT